MDLLSQAVTDPQSADGRESRYAVRRTLRGLELYEAKYTGLIDGEPEYHGHPATYVPARVLRLLRDRGLLSDPEYRSLVKSFGTPSGRRRLS